MQQGTDFHHVKIRSVGGEPTAEMATVEIDGKVDRSITSLRLDMSANGLTWVTATFLATVDVEVDGKVDAKVSSAASQSVAGVTPAAVVSFGNTSGGATINPALATEAFWAGVRQGGMLQ